MKVTDPIAVLTSRVYNTLGRRVHRDSLGVSHSRFYVDSHKWTWFRVPLNTSIELCGFCGKPTITVAAWCDFDSMRLKTGCHECDMQLLVDAVPVS